jgi:hypothetical protein
VRFALSEAEFARVRGGEQKAIEVKLELADGSPTRRRQAQLLRLDRRHRHRHGADARRAAQPEARAAPRQYVRVRVVAGTQQAFVVPQAR